MLSLPFQQQQYLLMKIPIIILHLLILGLTAPSPHPLFLNDQLIFNYTVNDSPQQYYQLTIPSSDTADVLLITAISETKQYLQIFIDFGNQSSVKYPDDTNSKQACYDLSLNTCPIELANHQNQDIVYITVVSKDKVDYRLMVIGSDINPINGSQPITLNFTNTSATVFSLKASDYSLKQVNVILSYDEHFDKILPFNIMGGQNKLPNTPATKIQGFDFGAFRQLMKFLNNSQNTVYYLVVTAFQGVVLDLQVSVPTSTLKNNTVCEGIVWDYMIDYQVSSYSYKGAFPSQINQQINIKALTISGSGSINVYYCGSVNPIFKYINQHGDSAHMIISADNRAACKDVMDQQTVQVRFQSLLPYLGYNIQFYMTKERWLWIRDRQYGIFDNMATQCQTYEIAWSQVGAQLQLDYDCEICEMRFVECTSLNGTTSCKDEELPSDQSSYTWTTNGNQYQVAVCPRQILSNDTDYNHYEIQFKNAQPAIRTIKLDYIHNQLIEMNEIQFYYIRPIDGNPNPEATFEVVVRTINGYVDLFTSLSDETPTMHEQYLDDDVDFWWEQTATYPINNATTGVYVGVYARSQSLYYIEAYVNENIHPTPTIQQIQIFDNINTITLETNQTAILSYKSHIIPYNVTIDPFPSCIEIYSSRKQMTDQKQCLNQMPTHTFYTYQLLLMRLSNSEDKAIKYNVNIIIEELIFTPQSYVALACLLPCYTNITIQMPSDAQLTIKHTGMGLLQQYTKDGEQYVNQSFTVNCSGVCRLNATLPYGGMMFVENAKMDSHYVSWVGDYMAIDDVNSMNMLYQMNQYSPKNQLILSSESSPLDIYYTGYKLNISQTNILNYKYNQPIQSPYQIRSDPFSPFSVVEIGQEYSCGENEYCFVTMSIFADLTFYPVPHGSVVQYSSNGYMYSIALNDPYTIRQMFGLSTFAIKQPGTYYVNVQPLSSCNPSITQLESKYGSISNGQSSIEFEVPNKDNCVYVVTATQCLYRTLLPGIQHSLYITPSSPPFQFISKQQKEFIIHASKEASISVSKMGEDCAIPSSYTFNRPSGSNATLTVDTKMVGNYIVSVEVDSDESTVVDVLIMFRDSPLTLIPNKSTYVGLPTKFVYNTKQPFYVCLKKRDYESDEEGDVSVMVYQNDQTFIKTNVTINRNYLECTEAKNIATNQIQEYNIEITGKPIDIEIMGAEMVASTKLYPSIVYKDHISNLESQCFRSDDISQTLTFALVFESPLTQDEFSLFSYPQVDFEVTMMGDNAVQVKRPILGENIWCLISKTAALMDYYITLEGNDISEVVKNQQKIHALSNTKEYSIIQYINPQKHLLSQSMDKNAFMVKAVNCEGTNLNIYGNDDYEQIVNGRTTIITNIWNDQYSTIGTLEMDVGYYYFGLMSENTSYSFELLDATNLQIEAKAYSLPNNTISTGDSNEDYVVVSLPPLVTSLNNTQPIYTLLLVDSSQVLNYTLQALGRCPDLNPEAFTKIIKKEMKKPPLPVFKISNDELPSNLSMFAYVSVALSNANTNVSYFYEPATFEIIPPEDTGGSSVLSWIIVLAIILLVLLGLRYLYVIWRRRKNRAEIEFEMSESNRQPNETVTNSNRGYGDFIDEAQ